MFFTYYVTRYEYQHYQCAGEKYEEVGERPQKGGIASADVQFEGEIPQRHRLLFNQAVGCNRFVGTACIIEYDWFFSVGGIAAHYIPAQVKRTFFCKVDYFIGGIVSDDSEVRLPPIQAAERADEPEAVVFLLKDRDSHGAYRRSGFFCVGYGNGRQGIETEKSVGG